MARADSFSLTSLHQSIGAYGEEWVIEFLAGFDVELTQEDSWNSSFDLTTANGKPVKIEVKTSYYHDSSNGQGTIRKRAQFNLAAKHDQDDYLAILVAIDSNKTHYVYFVPGSEIKTKMVQLTSEPNRYNGKYAQYLFDFDTFFEYINQS